MEEATKYSMDSPPPYFLRGEFKKIGLVFQFRKFSNLRDRRATVKGDICSAVACIDCVSPSPASMRIADSAQHVTIENSIGLISEQFRM